MNFFNNLSQYLNGTDINITIHGGDNLLVVSVLPKSTSKESDVKLKPLIFRGTPEELDEGFLSSLVKPLTQANELLRNASEFEAQLESEKKSLKEKKDKKDQKSGDGKDTSTTVKGPKNKKSSASTTKVAATDEKQENATVLEKPPAQQTSMFPES